MSSSTGVVSTTKLIGRDGLDRIAAAGQFAVPDASKYSAVWQSFRVDAIEVGAWTTSPISGSAHLNSPPSAILLIAVTAGLLTYSIDEHAVELTPGCVSTMHSSMSVQFAIPTRTKILRIVVPEAMLTFRLERSAVSGCSSTPLTASLLSVVDSVLEPGGGAISSSTSRAIRALVTATIDSLANEPKTDTRIAIVDYVERHLTDPELSPVTIARAFDISVRWVHRLFDQEQTTLARYIRMRRLDLVAGQLVAGSRAPAIGLLAKQSGFTSGDNLARAFKARYGVSITEYNARIADSCSTHADVADK